jgi:hypothetical protein
MGPFAPLVVMTAKPPQNCRGSAAAASRAGVVAAAPDAWSDPLACKEVEEQIVKFGRRLHICHVTDVRYGDLVGAVNARR